MVRMKGSKWVAAQRVRIAWGSVCATHTLERGGHALVQIVVQVATSLQFA